MWLILSGLYIVIGLISAIVLLYVKYKITTKIFYSSKSNRRYQNLKEELEYRFNREWYLDCNAKCLAAITIFTWPITIVASILIWFFKLLNYYYVNSFEMMAKAGERNEKRKNVLRSLFLALGLNSHSKKLSVLGVCS